MYVNMQAQHNNLLIQLSIDNLLVCMCVNACVMHVYANACAHVHKHVHMFCCSLMAAYLF